MSDSNPQPWEVWHAKFAYEEKKGYKFRPVVILGCKRETTLVAMITSATNKYHMKHDYVLANWMEAGLVKPSLVRIDRIAAIPASCFGTAGKIGRLSYDDIAAITQITESM